MSNSILWKVKSFLEDDALELVRKEPKFIRYLLLSTIEPLRIFHLEILMLLQEAVAI